MTTPFSSFLSRAGVRAFVFDLADIVEHQAATSFAAVCKRAGATGQVDLCLTHPCATVEELAYVASTGTTPLNEGFTPELLTAQLYDSVSKCTMSDSGVRTLLALRKYAHDVRWWTVLGGYSVGVFGNFATPYKDHLVRLGVDTLADCVVFSCDEGCKLPSVQVMRSFSGLFGLSPQQCAFVMTQPPSTDPAPLPSNPGGYTPTHPPSHTHMHAHALGVYDTSSSPGNSTSTSASSADTAGLADAGVGAGAGVPLGEVNAEAAAGFEDTSFTLPPVRAGAGPGGYGWWKAPPSARGVVVGAFGAAGIAGSTPPPPAPLSYYEYFIGSAKPSIVAPIVGVGDRPSSYIALASGMHSLVMTHSSSSALPGMPASEPASTGGAGHVSLPSTRNSLGGGGTQGQSGDARAATPTPDIVVDRPTRVLLPDYNLAQLVGEALGFPNPLDPNSFGFGPFLLPVSQVFYCTPRSIAFVNLRPVVPGHVLVIPRRRAARFSELGPEEISDLWSAAQKVGSMIQAHYKADALTLTIQDGPAAGQSVAHTHVHILPRFKDDLKNNDDVYEMIDSSDQRRPSSGVSRAVINPPVRDRDVTSSSPGVGAGTSAGSRTTTPTRPRPLLHSGSSTGAGSGSGSAPSSPTHGCTSPGMHASAHSAHSAHAPAPSRSLDPAADGVRFGDAGEVHRPAVVRVARSHRDMSEEASVYRAALAS